MVNSGAVHRKYKASVEISSGGRVYTKYVGKKGKKVNKLSLVCHVFILFIIYVILKFFTQLLLTVARILLILT
jgi:hypothetical protein